MNTSAIYIGIDLATTASKTGCCILAEDPDGILNSLKNELVIKPKSRLERLIPETLVFGIRKIVRNHPNARITVAIDAPFSWPKLFKEGILEHCPSKPFDFEDPFQPYRYRETDLFVERILRNARPLSVSTDRIGVVAVVASHVW